MSNPAATSAVEPLPMLRDESGPTAHHAGIVTIRLEQPGSPVVVMDQDLVRRLEATIRALPRGTTGLILASGSARVFVAGADLKFIQPVNMEGAGSTDSQLDAYLAYGQRVFGMIADLPYPTAAAVNGAALGGGLELAMHCDGLIGAPSASGKPYPVGLPEAGLNLCPGWGGSNLFPARIDAAEAIKRTAAGAPMNFDEAKVAGLFDRVAPTPDSLLDTAKAWIAETRATGRLPRRDGAPSKWIGRVDSGRKVAVMAALERVRGELTTAPAMAVIDCIRVGLDSGWQAALDAERKHLIRLRNQPAARAAIQAFFDKAAKPKA